MNYSFVLREEASKEFAEAYVWYEEQRDGLGITFELAVYDKINLICQNPLHYKISYKKYHQAVVERFPFVVVYTINEKLKQIVVFAIFHTSRNPQKQFRRKN